MKTIALYNIKGGVGKTASAVNLAYLSARDNISTLLCDLDPQGSATFYFRIRPSKKYSSKKLLKGGKKIEKNIKGSDYDNLDVLPADMSYRNLDIRLDDLKNSQTVLKKLLKPLGNDYELIVLDCPPNITLVSENIFQAATTILVPVIPTTLSMLTFEKLAGFFKGQQLNEKKILAFFSMVERRKKMHIETMEQHGIANKKFLTSYVPYCADVEKMGLRREPVVAYRMKSRASQAYINLWQELKQAIKL